MGIDPPHLQPPPQPSALLTAAAIAPYALAALLWLAQALPATRLGHPCLASAEGALIGVGYGARKVALLAPRFAALAWLVALGTTLRLGRPGQAQRATLLGRPPVYRAAGAAALAALCAAALLDLLLGLDLLRLRGPNLFLAQLALWTAVAECGAARILGPRVAQAERAMRQAAQAAQLAGYGANR